MYDARSSKNDIYLDKCYLMSFLIINLSYQGLTWYAALTSTLICVFCFCSLAFYCFLLVRQSFICSTFFWSHDFIGFELVVYYPCLHWISILQFI